MIPIAIIDFVFFEAKRKWDEQTTATMKSIFEQAKDAVVLSTKVANLEVTNTILRKELEKKSDTIYMLEEVLKKEHNKEIDTEESDE